MRVVTKEARSLEVIRYVDPDAAGSANGLDWTNAYTSLNAWEAAEQVNLTLGDKWMHVYCRASSGTGDTTATSINGWITGINNYILVETASTDRTEANGWNTAKYRLEITDGNALTVSDNHVRIDGLQIGLIRVSAGGSALRSVSIAASNDLRASNCRIRGANDGASSSNGIIASDGNEIWKIWNCIIYDFIVDANWGYGIRQQYGGTMDIYNCTVYNCGRGVAKGAGTVNVYNAVSFYNSDDFYNSPTVISYCASDDNNGTNNVAESSGDTHWTDDFIDAASGDFRLKAGSNLIDAGDTDPGNGLYNDDIEGTIRS